MERSTTVKARLLVIAALVTGLLAPAASVLAAPTSASPMGAQLAEVRRATARYHDVGAAVADGYVVGSPCVPGMGYHYVRGNPMELAPAGLVASEPNILVYAPRADGSLKLVAVEYGANDAAVLFGRSFDQPAPPGSGGPPFFALHAWVWQPNPDGVFAARNRAISC